MQERGTPDFSLTHRIVLTEYKKGFRQYRNYQCSIEYISQLIPLPINNIFIIIPARITNRLASGSSIQFFR